jgi:hypothetical protein
MTTTKSANKKTTRRIARKFTSNFTRKKARAISRRKQLEIKAALERHSRKCIICHHPERESIEEEFLHWRAPWKLAEDYNLADYRTIYRHARAAGLLLQRRENLHSGLDAFVEAVDDVKFTGDTILRAMRAYSCIDRHGRWTEIPTQVHISTFRDPGPAQSPAPYPENDSDVIDIEPEYSNRASLRDATACAASPAQAFSVTEGDSDDDDPDDDPESDGSENDAEDLEPAALPQAAPQPTPGRRATVTNCAAPPAQAVPKLPSDSRHRGRTVTATACAASPAQDSAHNAAPESAPAPQSGAMQHSNPASRSDSTACAAPPAQAFPVSLRHPGPYGISAPSATGSNPAPQPGFSRINLIYRPAIRNDGKP